MRLEPRFTAHVATVLAAMARAGRGMAWLPMSLIARDLADGDLVRAGDETWGVSIDIRLFRPRPTDGGGRSVLGATEGREPSLIARDGPMGRLRMNVMFAAAGCRWTASRPSSSARAT